MTAFRSNDAPRQKPRGHEPDWYRIKQTLDEPGKLEVPA